MIIIPGILVNNVTDLQNQVGFVKDKVEWLHLDVMDGEFVENTNLSLAEITSENLSNFSVEVHLMVENPLDYLEDCQRLGIKRLVIHYEAIHDQFDIIDQIKAQGFQVTVALNPGTTVSYLENIADNLDGVLLMTVVPGKQGQEFMPEVLEKIASIRIMNPDAIIGIDGGVKLDNLDEVKKYNLDYAVVGSGLWTADDPGEMLKQLKEKLN